MKYVDILNAAKTIKNNVEKNYELGKSPKWSYYHAKVILNGKKDVPNIKIANAEKNTGNNLSRQVKRSVYLDMADRFTEYVEKNHQLPNNIKVTNKVMRVTDYTYMFANLVVIYSKTKALPKTIDVNSKAFVKPEDTNVVFSAFVKKFGKVTTFTDALRKIWNKGYGYYFDDFLTNLQVINNLANGGQKPNCVDVCQMMWNVAKGLGYEVRCLHVYCPRDDITHVRLQVKHSKYTGGDWEDYDPAAVIDGEGINSLWCNGSGSYVIAINPNWFISNVNR